MQIQKYTIRDKITFDYEDGGPMALYYDEIIPRIINPVTIRTMQKNPHCDDALYRKFIFGIASTTKATMRYHFKTKTHPKGRVKKIEGH